MVKLPHTVARFKNGHEDQDETGDFKKHWHLVAKGVGDGEFTACGLSYVDGYDPDQKQVDRGGITCPSCLTIIKYYKQVSL